MKTVIAVFGGAGRVGALVSSLLLDSEHYTVVVVDQNIPLDVLKRIKRCHKDNPPIPLSGWVANSVEDVVDVLTEYKVDAVISCLPYMFNKTVFDAARRLNIHYFDTTEDVKTVEHIKRGAQGASAMYVPMCGIAPGFSGWRAYQMMRIERVTNLKIYVGALPSTVPRGRYKHAATWSLEGLVNEYINPAIVLKDGKKVSVPSLVEESSIVQHPHWNHWLIAQTKVDMYYARNTSGGIGGLLDICPERMTDISYMTLRYEGHYTAVTEFLKGYGDVPDHIKKEKLLREFEEEMPITKNDKVVVRHVGTSADGGEQLLWEHVYKPLVHNGYRYTAIQATTAYGVVCVADALLRVVGTQPELHGFIHHETIPVVVMDESPYFRQYLL